MSLCVSCFELNWGGSFIFESDILLVPLPISEVLVCVKGDFL